MTMPNSKELELERNVLLQDMAAKIDFIYQILSQASIQQKPEEQKSERKNSKKTKKSSGV
jgi:hypothetical protein